MIDATHYQATVTAVDSFTGTGTVSLAAGSWTDAALNLGGAGSDSVPIDRQNPTVVVDLVDGALSDGDSSSVVTFTFSEAPGASFTEADIQVSAGLTLNAGSLSMIDATHYQATVTAVDSFTGTGTVSLAAGSWTDAALNLGGAGSDSVPIDRQNPTVVVDLVDGALSDGDSSSVVTFTFSEAPGASFTEADIQVSAGLTLNAGSLSMIDATHYQATVTAVDSFTGTGTVSLAAGSWTDAALNLGGAGSDSVPIDRQNPTVVVDLVDGALSDGDSSSVVTFTFSEAPGASFTEADIQVSAGLTLNAGSLSMIDATHYQATVTAVDSFTGTGTVSLAAGSWTDAALNLGGAGSDSVPIDRQNPSVESVDASDLLITDADVGSGTFHVTVVFDQAMTADGSADPTLTFNPAVASTLTFSGDSWSADHTTYTANYNVADANVLQSGVTIDVTGAKDANGNTQTDYTPQAEFSIDTAPHADPNDFDDQATGSTVVTVGTVVHGTPGNDQIAGGGNSGNIIYGGAGNDTINGTGQGDTIYGGSGNDTLKGNGAEDLIFGGSGNDTIDGSNGSDIIIGGYGGDQLTGGNENDTFRFLDIKDSQPGAGSFDIIKDFTHNSDHLEFVGISGVTDIQEVVGSANTVDPHSISWFVDAANNQTIVYVNTTDTANHVDMEIHLTGTNINLSHTDIIFHA